MASKCTEGPPKLNKYVYVVKSHSFIQIIETERAYWILIFEKSLKLGERGLQDRVMSHINGNTLKGRT